MNGKTVVITGGSEGLGKAVARKLVAEGAAVILIAQNAQTLAKTASDIAGNVSVYACDISSPKDVRDLVAVIITEHPRIDVLINCAGIWTDEELEKEDPDRRKKVLEVNTLGTIEVTKAFEPLLVRQNTGHILNVISTSGNSDTSSGDNTLWQTYGASKWAIAGFTRALKDSLNGTGVRVTGFYPGGFESSLYENAKKTDAHNQPWMMETDDVADTLIFCLTRPADVLIEKMVITKYQA